MDKLALVLDRLARPVDFARHESGKARDTVKNLGDFVSRQVLAILAVQVHPSAVEADLLALRQLFADYDQCKDQRERRRRLEEARVVLDRLRNPAPPAPGPGIGQEPPVDRAQSHSASRELWAVPIQYARGVGPARAALMGKLGIRTVEDALWYVPWRYEDRSGVVPIGNLAPGMKGTICGTLVECTVSRAARRNLTLTRLTVADQSGSIQAVFFNQPYLDKVFKPGTRVMLSGLAAVGRSGWPSLQLDTPQYEVLGEEWEVPIHVGRIVPVYHETKGLGSRQIRAIIKGLLDQHGSGLVEILPEAIRARQQLPTLHQALPGVHFPPRDADAEQLARGVTPAHRRLAFEELFLLELALGLRHRTVKEEPKQFRFDLSTPLLPRLRKQLRFELTRAQERVLREITGDLASPHPMNRLLQGDVGCGKTIVALHAMLLACGSGYQAALMAPTEILAEQHYLNLRELLRPLDVRVALLRGGHAKSRQAVLDEIEHGKAQVVVGTHALIQKGVRFARLALAVIDEQHKFGVLQRKMLLEKGYRPDVLVMTATPIPRTLAMTVYGDLDVSVIDELPAGRKPIRTWLFPAGQRRRAYQIIKDEVRAGRQAYVVYPLVEESEKVDLQAAEEAAERLQKNEFRELHVGLLHGRMKSTEKERVMADFKAGRVQVLVATTVIEVGVDVPNATVMLIDHAERFGLAQLHQLRGRVGRGAQQSSCLLVTSSARSGGFMGGGSSGQRSPSRERLDALVKSTDGFVIAEEDLRIRGPGEFFGVRQWGAPEFRAANLIRDARLLEQARAAAQWVLAKDPRLIAAGHRPAREAMLRRWQTKLDLGGIS
jgi:ATP-dependent DNA helicase RecG